ncbi:MAG: (deoxy)nucleoside triphosphate pyrophosphohydrolase [Planctomycetaceae bacterium]|nr:(deoxy)nucleoside triphosphate pyrophosphohydrolase [Planctomycetales bacterium]MCB9926539.1 (deoxy)nucleoside triphosphate pyrophosphohydrolase [Planctomycetaceae bacterium]
MADEPTQIAIAIVEQEGCFLVGKRPPGKPLAGYAEFPGGRVESGETPDQAVVRECREETGLSIEVVGSYEERCHRYSHDRVHLHFFRCRLTKDGESLKSPFTWVEREQLGSLRFPAANDDILRELMGRQSGLD